MLIIGHRGAMGYEPENTLRSFQRAIDLRVDMIEFDVHLCKTGELVVIHDEKVNRTTNGRGLVADKTLSELKKLDAGNGEKIPTLEEVLNLIDRKVKVNIELKGPHTATPTLKIIQKYLNQGWIYDDFLVSSFDSPELEIMRKRDKKINLAVAIDKDPLNYIQFSKDINAYSIHPIVKRTDQKFVELAHQNNLKVFVWTIKPKEIKKMINLKVNGIFTNYPDKFKIYVNQRKKNQSSPIKKKRCGRYYQTS
jgi:glycerophosphoryl diester phosphodiesterase